MPTRRVLERLKYLARYVRSGTQCADPHTGLVARSRLAHGVGSVTKLSRAVSGRRNETVGDWYRSCLALSNVRKAEGILNDRPAFPDHRAGIRPDQSTQALSPVELTQAFLARVKHLDGKLNSHLLVLEEQALADAKQAESEIAAGQWKGPLHGIPIGLKDIYNTAGIRTTGHSALFKDHVPAEDAFTVTLLRKPVPS